MTMTFHTTNIQFEVWAPDGTVLVEAHRLRDPRHREPQPPAETEWKLQPRFHHQFGENVSGWGKWEAPVVGEDNARRAANELAALVCEHNESLEAVLRNHHEAFKFSA